MRLFLGVPAPAHARLRAVADAAPDGLRRVPEGSWHVTLRFFEDAQPDDVVAAMGQVALPAADSIRLSGLGAFPNAERARVLWVRVDSSVLDVHATIADAMRRFAPIERRPFHAHITLGRWRDPVDARAFVAGTELQAAGVADRIVLWRSVLAPDGPRYEAVDDWSLPAP